MSILGRLYRVARSHLPRSSLLGGGRFAGGGVGSVGDAASGAFSGRGGGEPAGSGGRVPSGGRAPSDGVGAGPATGGANPQEAAYYANLELPHGVGYPEIKRAYRDLLKRYHPDRHHQDADKAKVAQAITQRLNEAMGYFEKKFERERT